MLFRVHVHVHVNDVNEFAPKWQAERLEFVIPEGVIVPNITKLVAVDGDKSKSLGQVCSYEIETEHQPFKVLDDGEKRSKCIKNNHSSDTFVLSRNIG